MKTTKCKKCNREIKNCNVKRHTNVCDGKVKDKSLDKYLKVERKYECPICKKLFKELGIKGHFWRMHTKEGEEAKRKLFGRKAWNQGLTKETNEIIKNQASKFKLEFKLGLRKSSILGISLEEKLGKARTQQIKENLSKNRSEKIKLHGVGGFKNTKVYKVENINSQVFSLRGTWEVKLAEWLNNNKIVWVGANELQYQDEQGYVKRYLPDFYLPNYDLFLEVKGYYDEKNRLKINNAVKQNKVKLFILFKKQIDLLKSCKDLKELLTSEIL